MIAVNQTLVMIKVWYVTSGSCGWAFH